jgi:hypothetical protein
MGRILQNEKKLKDAMNHYKKAFELNESYDVPNFNSVYKDIAYSLFKDPEPARIFDSNVFQRVYNEAKLLLKEDLAKVSSLIGDVFNKDFEKENVLILQYLKNA